MITSQLLAKLFPFTRQPLRDRFIDALNKYLPEFEITSAKRIRAFLATCGMESDYFRAVREYASGWDYDKTHNPKKAKELGNINIGDGPKYKGGGLIETTGRNEYRALNPTIGKRLGINFEANPEAIETPDAAVLSACQYWKDHNLNSYADREDFYSIEGIVNRGQAGLQPKDWAKRNALYQLCKTVISNDFSFSVTLSSQDEPQSTKQLSSSDSSQADDSSQDNMSAKVDDLSSNNQSSQNQPIGSSDSQQTALVSNNNTDDDASDAVDNSKLKAFSDKYLKHLQDDSVKNIFGVLLGRAATPIISLWMFGLTGKIFLIITILIVVGCASYTIYKYHSRLFGWIKTIADSLLGN